MCITDADCSEKKHGKMQLQNFRVVSMRRFRVGAMYKSGRHQHKRCLSRLDPSKIGATKVWNNQSAIAGGSEKS